jgi:hypothetical protein
MSQIWHNPAKIGQNLHDKWLFSAVKSSKKLGLPVIEKTAQSKQSPKRRKFDQSGHPAQHLDESGTLFCSICSYVRVARRWNATRSENSFAKQLPNRMLKRFRCGRQGD